MELCLRESSCQVCSSCQHGQSSWRSVQGTRCVTVLSRNISSAFTAWLTKISPTLKKLCISFSHSFSSLFFSGYSPSLLVFVLGRWCCCTKWTCSQAVNQKRSVLFSASGLSPPFTTMSFYCGFPKGGKKRQLSFLSNPWWGHQDSCAF